MRTGLFFVGAVLAVLCALLATTSAAAVTTLFNSISQVSTLEGREPEKTVCGEISKDSSPGNPGRNDTMIKTSQDGCAETGISRPNFIKVYSGLGCECYFYE
jgi:hypothetical protein